MKRVRTSLFFVAVVGLLGVCGLVWGVESSEQIQGLISHWKFDEGSGTTAYDSAGDNHGTIYGAQWTTGQIDGALSFDGSYDYVAVGDKESLELQSFTLTFWSQNDHPEEDLQGGIAKGKVFGSVGEFSYKLDFHLGSARAGVTNTSNNSFHAYVEIGDTNWHMWTMTAGDGILSIYKDGVIQDSAPYTGPIDYTKNFNNFAIGAYTDGKYAFDGIIDDVRIYDRALSSEEVEQLYEEGPGDLLWLEIVGPGEVAENFSASYKAIAHYDNNSTGDVTDSAEWAVEPNTAANIDDYGVLTTKDVVKRRSATILASYTEGDVAVDAEKAIDILAICPTGTALRFDGVDDYVDCGNDASLKLTGHEITIMAWINITGNGVNWPRILLSGEVNHAYTLTKHDLSDDRILWRPVIDGDMDKGEVSSAWSLPRNQWHMVAGVYDGSASHLYIDGMLSGSAVASGALTTDSRNVLIGGEPKNHASRASFFDGMIDEVAIYNRALSVEEIRANMHTRLAGDEAGLVGYWDFDESEGQIVYDLSGNGNDGQLGSTPNPDVSDPAWVDSDAPIGICSLYQIATMAAERALWRKLALLEELQAALAQEWTAYEALEELLESGDYGDLNKGNIVTAKQKIHSATQHEEQQSIGALDKSVEKLKDALSALGYEPEPPPSQASNPNPADEATGVGINTNLSWTAGPNAVSHDVYFGTNSPGTFRGNQTATTFDPGTMSANTTYYWRIDEVNPHGTTTGTVWSFTTGSPPPGQASNPTPADGARWVGINADLSWTAGPNAVSHDVYFGTTSPGTFRGNQTATTFDPGTMAGGATHYWRIDEVNAGGTTTGTVWSFTTGGLR